MCFNFRGYRTAKLEDVFLACLFQAVNSVENLKLGWESDLLTHISGGSRISPRRGLQLPGGGGPPTYDFAKISQKLHDIERIWTGGASLAPPLDPPLQIEIKFDE